MKKLLIAIAIMTTAFLCTLWWLFDIQIAVADESYSVTNENNKPINARIYKYTDNRGKEFIVYLPQVDLALLINNQNDGIYIFPKEDLYRLPFGLMLRCDKSEPVYSCTDLDIDETRLVTQFHLTDDLMQYNTFLELTSYGKMMIIKRK